MSDIKISHCPLCKGEVEDTGARVNYSKMIVTLRLKYQVRYNYEP